MCVARNKKNDSVYVCICAVSAVGVFWGGGVMVLLSVFYGFNPYFIAVIFEV